MDSVTRLAVRTHLAAIHESLQHANNVPVDVCLPFLEEARDNLAAAIDTIEQARKEAAEAIKAKPRLPGLTTLGRAESLQALAESRIADTRLTQLINQSSHHA